MVSNVCPLCGLPLTSQISVHAETPAQRAIEPLRQKQARLRLAPQHQHFRLYLILRLLCEPFCLDSHYLPSSKPVGSIPSQEAIIAQLLFVGLSMPASLRMPAKGRKSSVCVRVRLYDRNKLGWHLGGVGSWVMCLYGEFALKTST